MRKTPVAASLLLCLMSSAAWAAELNVFSAGAVQEAERELAAEFTKATGNTVKFTVGTVGQIQGKLKEGGPVDVIVVSTPALAGLEKSGDVKPGSGQAIARIGIGVGVKDGAPVPDISTPEKFKDAMLKARAITYMNPAQGASSGIATAKIMKDLGIEAQMTPKTKLTDAGYSADRVASGEVDYAIQNQSEIIPVKGVKLAGPLPAPLQVYTPYSAGIATQTQHAKEAEDFIRYLKREASAPVWTHAGIEPAK